MEINDLFDLVSDITLLFQLFASTFNALATSLFFFHLHTNLFSIGAHRG